MLTKQNIEKPRSPYELSKFVQLIKKIVSEDRSERRKAIRKRGLYKILEDEIIPLAIFASEAYPPTYKISPVIGTLQGYDAIVKDGEDRIVDYIEITRPQDGKRKAEDARKILSRGYGDIHVYSPGEDIDKLMKHILKTCKKKALKDYSNCTLVITVDFAPPFSEHRSLYLLKLEHAANQLREIPFKAKKVVLLILPFRKTLTIKEFVKSNSYWTSPKI